MEAGIKLDLSEVDSWGTGDEDTARVSARVALLLARLPAAPAMLCSVTLVVRSTPVTCLHINNWLYPESALTICACLPTTETGQMCNAALPSAPV